MSWCLMHAEASNISIPSGYSWCRCLLRTTTKHTDKAGITGPGNHPTKGISIEFKIRSKFTVLWFEIYKTNRKQILHTSQQCDCRDLCKMLMWFAKYVMNKSITKFHWILNSIVILFVGQPPVIGTFEVCSGVHRNYQWSKQYISWWNEMNDHSYNISVMICMIWELYNC